MDSDIISVRTVDFGVIKHAVAKQFERMQRYPMFRVAVTKDELWNTYIGSFPEGSNPVHRKRTEHDCSCCKQFIRSVGDVVALIDGETESVWDVVGLGIDDRAYTMVAAAMANLVHSKPIAEPFLSSERTAGTDRTFEQLLEGSAPNNVKRWDHFHVNIDKKFVDHKTAIPTRLGELRADHDVLLRGLKEITLYAIDTVLELVAQGSLYRGEENLYALTEFRKLRAETELYPERAEVLAWTAMVVQSVSRIRNTAIGTLLVDLSKGVELDDAVKSFETMVAGPNYKRPTALVTKGMIEKARAKLEEMGLTSAIERRYATIEDITINNVLFADRASGIAGGDVFADLSATVPDRPKNLERIEEISIEKFLSDVLPKAETIEVLFENKHSGNLVSLIAPSDPTSGQLFKWPNRFSWSYNGEMADSIKERVKKAGGNVTGDLCCRLAWDYTDDLDLHMREPDGNEIFYGHRRSGLGGILDVDANGMDGLRDNPVENIFYANRSTMKPGIYTLGVHNYYRRSAGVGFEVEIDYLGTVHRFAYDKVLKTRESLDIATMRYDRESGISIVSSLPGAQLTRTTWGIPTQTFRRVKAVMMSPNFWDDHAVGNKHYFFMLDGCANDGTARGFYNEFLKSELDAHRKVFEMIGSKLKPAPSDRQLSGLGFSSTQRNALICRVKGNFSRIVKINF